MRPRRSVLSVLLVCAATAIVASACGGAGASTPATAGPTSAAPTGTGIAATAVIDAPAEVKAGASFVVSWTCTNPRRDSIIIVPKGTTKVPDELARTQSFNTVVGSPFTWTAPATAGEYELWYVQGDETGASILARRLISVTP